MTVFFCDMKGFTSISEGLTARGLVNVINQYLTTMSSPIRQHNGIIDKYIGDAIMAFWGPPFNSDEDQARLACLAALDQLARLNAFRQELPELGFFDSRIVLKHLLKAPSACKQVQYEGNPDAMPFDARLAETNIGIDRNTLK